MKHFLLLFFGLLFLVGAYSQFIVFPGSISKNENAIIKSNKIYREEVYDYIFNRKGIKDSSLFAIFSYDSMGNKLTGIHKTKNNIESIEKYSYVYDVSGRTLREIDSLGMNRLWIHEYDYDSIGNEITKYEYNEDTTRLYIDQIIYNEKNQRLKLLIKIQENPQYLSKLYYYDQDDEIDKEESFDNKGNIIYSYIYEYDKALNKKSVYLENDNGRNIENEFFYNSDKLCVRINGKRKSNAFISRQGSNYETVDQVTSNIYNSDKTVFETDLYRDGKMVQIQRHYYRKD